VTFGYSYKTSDGARHESTFEARCKEDVFAALRVQKVKPIRVWLIRRWYNVSKRSAALVVVSAVLVMAVAYLLKRTSRPQLSDYVLSADISADGRTASKSPRRQISEMPENLEECFPYRSEAYLAQFTCPARHVDASPDAVFSAAAADLPDAVVHPLVLTDDDSRSMVELKRIITGMKEEARLILATGRTPDEVLRYFFDRQKMEEEHRKRIVRQVDEGELAREDANATFRTMGFAEIGD